MQCMVAMAVLVVQVEQAAVKLVVMVTMVLVVMVSVKASEIKQALMVKPEALENLANQMVTFTQAAVLVGGTQMAAAVLAAAVTKVSRVL